MHSNSSIILPWVFSILWHIHSQNMDGKFCKKSYFVWTIESNFFPPPFQKKSPTLWERDDFGDQIIYAPLFQVKKIGYQRKEKYSTK